VVQTVTSSVVYSSGSNVFGNNIANTQTFTGSVLITGSVGIGTSSPSGLLNLAVSSGATIFNIDNVTAQYGNITFRESGAGKAYLQYLSSTFSDASRQNSFEIGTNAASSFISFRPVDAERMRITSAGNVLIGKTSSTGGVLQVSNGTNMFNVDYDATGPYITAVNNANTVYKRLTIDASEILFDISATERMRITSEGTIQQVVPSNGLYYNIPSNTYTGYVYSSINNNGGSFYLGIERINGSGLCTGALTYSTVLTTNNATHLTFGTNSNQRMMITPNGEVLMHSNSFNSALVGQLFGTGGDTYFTTNAQSTLYLNRLTNNGQLLTLQYNSATVGSISTNANSLPSDRNFKKDITDISIGLDLVTKLRPVHYRHNFDDADEALSNGIIAQELEEALLECGVEKNSLLMLQHKPNDKEGESQYWVDYTKMIPVLVKAIQELQAQITELKNK